ncbi:MAG TPA: DNA translocase FtsK 4TM domain-containing protein [Bacillota bacterium]|nr:DNA translocase FtsK 4TM domain-containing protein [Bacillota bacterium]
MARTRKRTKKAKNNKTNPRLMEQKLEITGVLLIGLALLSFIAVFFNSSGVIGEIMQRSLEYLFGRRGAIFPIVFLGVVGILFIVRRQTGIISRRFYSLSLLFLWALVILHLYSGVALTPDNWDGATEGSGIVGHLLTVLLMRFCGKIGTLVFLGAWLIVAFILAVDKPLIELMRSLVKPSENRPDTTKKLEKKAVGAGKTAPPNAVFDNYQSAEQSAAVEEPAEEAPVEKETRQSQVLATFRNVLKERKTAKSEETVPEEADPGKKEEVVFKPPVKAGPYKLPDLNLIEAAKTVKKANRPIDQSKQLEETLAHFGVQVKVLEVHNGPVITRYDLQPAPGVKVSKIVNLTDDLALALAAKGLRLEAPIPGKAAIGVEVPNKETQIVTLREVLEAKPFWNSGKLTIGLGVDIGGEVVVADLSKMPHLLVAGSTGSGKSVCVNTMIMSVLYKAFPDEVKFIMIDPKMVELSMYNGIPHLMAPVVTEAKKAAGVLHMVVNEMERRYKMFADARVRDLEKYNEQLTEGEPFPHIVVIIDELADLMMVAPVEVEDSICRLAQMARATGIHLVVATQRPSVDVITGLIKANIPSRIAFAVSSQVDSRTILDSVGAERLLGRGDMLFSPVGSMKPRRVQGALVTEKEIEAVIKHWKEQGEPQYQEQFVNVPEKEDTITVEDDELFWDAVRIVVEHGQASASVLQRRLRVGYTRAARLVDMMEGKGIIGPYEGSKPREVYITARQLEEIKNRTQTE